MTFFLKINASWVDGPCRSCYCDATSTRGTCNKIECAPPLTSSDYVVVAHTKYGQCCPSYKKESCIFNGTVYSIGSEWSSFDPCVAMSCKLDNNGEAFMIESVKSCNTECPLVNIHYISINYHPMYFVINSKRKIMCVLLGMDVLTFGEQLLWNVSAKVLCDAKQNICG